MVFGNPVDRILERFHTAYKEHVDMIVLYIEEKKLWEAIGWLNELASMREAMKVELKEAENSRKKIGAIGASWARPPDISTLNQLRDDMEHIARKKAEYLDQMIVNGQKLLEEAGVKF